MAFYEGKIRKSYISTIPYKKTKKIQPNFESFTPSFETP
jgi:hypothetical protein